MVLGFGTCAIVVKKMDLAFIASSLPQVPESSAARNCIKPQFRVIRKAENAEWKNLISNYESSSDESDGKEEIVPETVVLESDDEEHGISVTSAVDVRTKNELAPPPTSTSDEIIVEGNTNPLGFVSAIVDNTVVIQSFKGLPAMDEDSVICLENGRSLGGVAEVFGPIYEPLYIIRFPSLEALTAITDLQVGVKVFYPVQQARPIDPRSIASKGSDASNVFDEEPLPNEVEFSDDEEEALARRLLKATRHPRHSHPAPNDDVASAAAAAAQPEAHAAARSGHGVRSRGGGRGGGGRGGRGGGRGRPDWHGPGTSGPRPPAAAGGPGPGAGPAAAFPYGFAPPPGFPMGGPPPFFFPPPGAPPFGFPPLAPGFGPGSRAVFAGAPPPGFGPPLPHGGPMMFPPPFAGFAPPAWGDERPPGM